MIFQVWITGILFLASQEASQTCGPPALNLNCSAPTPCCSISNSCGNTTLHCGVGCLAQHSAPGACISSSEESTSQATTSAASDPRCVRDPSNSSKNYGPCKAPDYCCSYAGYCGVGDNYCIGCQKGFGRCPILCDGSKPCGVYGRVSFAFSCITIVLSFIAVVISICALWRVPQPNRTHFNLFSMFNRN
jgi:hypothetical protein